MKIKRKSILRQKVISFSYRFALLAIVGTISMQSVFGASQQSINVSLLDSQRQLNQSEDGNGDVKDGYMFVADIESGSLKVINTTNVSNPITKVATSGYIHQAEHVRVIGDYVAVTGSETADSNGLKTLVIFSIINLENVHEVGRVSFSQGAAVGAGTCTSIQGLYSAGSNLVIDAACDSFAVRKLLTVDLSTPASPAFADSFDYTSQSPEYGTGSQYDSGLFYLKTQGDRSFLAVDMSDIYGISLNYTVNLLSLGLASEEPQYKQGNYLYMFAKLGAPSNPIRFYTIDISNPASPTVVGSIVTPDFDGTACNYGTHTTMSLALNNLLTQCGQRIFNINISNPTSPVIVGSANVLYSSNLIGVDNSDRIYLNDGWNYIELEVHDGSNLSQAPVFVGAKNYDLTMRDMTSNVLIPPGSDTAIIVGGDSPIVRTIDISDPNNLSVIGDQYLTQNGRLIDGFGVYHSYDTSLSVDGQFMFVLDHSTSSGGYLTVVDISDLSNISIATRTALPSERVQTGVIVGNIWHVLTENSLRTYDINPTTGAISALDSTTYTMPAGASLWHGQRGLAVVNGAAIMMFGVQSARTVNVSDPSNIGPATATNLPFLSSYTQISRPHVIGNTMYLVSGDNLYAVNAANAASLSTLSSVSGGFGGSTYSAAIDELDSSTLLIAEEQGGATIAKVNISNPASIAITGAAPDSDYNGLFPEGADGWGSLYSYTVKDNIVYGVSGGSDSNFYSIDISDIASPEPLDVLTNQIAFYQPNTIKYINDRLYIGGTDMDESDADMSIFSLVDPDKPVLSGTSLHAYDSFYSMVQKDDYLYTTRDYGGLVVYDISKPDFAVPLKMVSELSEAYDIATEGDYLYIADDSNGLMIYDITDRENPVQVSTFADGSFTSLDSLEVRGDRVYGVDADANQFVVIDVSNPAAPSTITTVTDLAIEQISQLTITGDSLYVSSKGNGTTVADAVTAFSLADPDAPVRQGQFVSGDSGMGYGRMEFYGDFVFVAAEAANKIDIIDFADNTGPALNQSIDGDSSLQGVNDMEIVNNRLYTISRLGQSINTYALAVITDSDDTEPPVVTPNVPAAPNAGVGANAAWHAYAAVGAFLIPILINRVRQKRRYNRS